MASVGEPADATAPPGQGLAVVAARRCRRRARRRPRTRRFRSCPDRALRFRRGKALPHRAAPPAEDSRASRAVASVVPAGAKRLTGEPGRAVGVAGAARRHSAAGAPASPRRRRSRMPARRRPRGRHTGAVSQAIEHKPWVNAGAHPFPGAHEHSSPSGALSIDVARRAGGLRLDLDHLRLSRRDRAECCPRRPASPRSIPGSTNMCDGARSVTVAVPSPNVHVNCVSCGEPTGANDSASGGDPVQRGRPCRCPAAARAARRSWRSP